MRIAHSWGLASPTGEPATERRCLRRLDLVSERRRRRWLKWLERQVHLVHVLVKAGREVALGGADGAVVDAEAHVRQQPGGRGRADRHGGGAEPRQALTGPRIGKAAGPRRAQPAGEERRRQLRYVEQPAHWPHLRVHHVDAEPEAGRVLITKKAGAHRPSGEGQLERLPPRRSRRPVANARRGGGPHLLATRRDEPQCAIGVRAARTVHRRKVGAVADAIDVDYDVPRLEGGRLGGLELQVAPPRLRGGAELERLEPVRGGEPEVRRAQLLLRLTGRIASLPLLAALTRASRPAVAASSGPDDVACRRPPPPPVA
mmetsp:Transcript_11083/g.35473  ORF Transcript_11083/g.35473 Transcript_11083/m.35473 type:complete len:316 (-) Transcript_11083:182-1129(-)